MRILSAICGAAVAAVMMAAASAGPFGLTFGEPLSKLKVLEKLDDNVYDISVPRPNDEFVSYTVMATKPDGICKIVAAGKFHRGDADGTHIRHSFYEILHALDGKYGKAKTVSDFKKQDTIWSGPLEYAMGLKQNEITLKAYWYTPAVVPELRAVELEADATSADTTYLALSYEGQNYGKCTAALRKKNRDAL